MNCYKKILLTGATGLIGKEAIAPLKELGFEVFALTIDANNPDCGVNWIECNLFDNESLEKAFQKVKPTHLLNFAWATTGDYLTSDINYKFLDAGLNLLEYFKKYGGKRAVYVGTCFEYEFKEEPLKETDKLNPTTLYAQCKNELREKAEIFCIKNNIEFGWGRIFYVFGHGENEKRLTAHIINSLKENKEVVINNGHLIKDYMYSKDIASAFAEFVDTNVCGCVNICTGKGVSLRDYALLIANKLKKKILLKVNEVPSSQPLKIVGDDSRLSNEVGYKIKYTLDKALEEILKG